MKKLKGLSKKGMAGIIAGVAVIVIVVGGMFFTNREEAYRQIQVYEIAGTARVERESHGTMEVYESMLLSSGDVVHVSENSYLQLKLDDKEYVYLEPQTSIRIEAVGTGDSAKSKILIEKGSMVKEMDEAFFEEADHEAEGPSATMAVRGVPEESDEDSKVIEKEE